jgi:hypothetical protein
VKIRNKYVHDSNNILIQEIKYISGRFNTLLLHYHPCFKREPKPKVKTISQLTAMLGLGEVVEKISDYF